MLKSIILTAVAIILAAVPGAAQPACIGDCNGDGEVRINELIIGVNIALGRADISACGGIDSNGDGEVRINELIQAVRSALDGCTAVTATPSDSTPTATATGTVATEIPTATPTGTVAASTPTATSTDSGPPTDTPTSPADTATPVPPSDTPTAPADTATPVPPSDTPTQVPTATVSGNTAENIAGASAAVVNGVSVIPNLISAVVAGFTAGSGGGAAVSGIPGGGAGGVDACELGGTVESDVGISGATVTLNDCKVSRGDGSALFSGDLDITFPTFADALNLRGPGTFTATIDFLDGQDAVIASSTIDLMGDVDIDPVPGAGNPCAIDTDLGAQLIDTVLLPALNGTVVSNVPGEGSAQVDFNATAITLAIQEYSSECIPVGFDLTLDGPASITQMAQQTLAFDLTFDDFTMMARSAGASGSTVSVSGDLIADCFGGTVSLSTPQELSFLLGQFCPGAGTIQIQDIGDVIYSASGVDVGGMLFPSCLDPALQSCVQ